MKLSKLFNSLPKRLAAGAIIALGVMLPVAATAADMVTLEGSMGVANQTAGDTRYSNSVNATYNQVVKFQVYYHNKENPDSGKIAQNLNVKINIPTGAGQTQTQTATVKADNSNTVTDQTTVRLDRSDAYLQYLPGSAVWRHNVGTNEKPNVIDTVISDNVVTSGAGLRLEDEKPCYNFSATVTVLARVMIPGTKIVKEVEKASETNKWSQNNTAVAGDTLKYKITYQNTGNQSQNNVVIRDNLPPKMTLVPNTTMVYNSTAPNGALDKSNNVTNGGLNIGNFLPGAIAYVTFEVKVPGATDLACGDTQFKNVGVAKYTGSNEYYNVAITTVNKTCTPPPANPVYNCDLLTLTKGDNRSVTARVDYTAQKGAKLKTVTYDFGDQKSTSVITTDKTTQGYQYTADGEYTVTAKLTFRVGNKDVTGVTSQECAKPISFTTNTPPSETPPAELPNTGAGNVISIVACSSILGAVLYRLFLGRRLAREQ